MQFFRKITGILVGVVAMAPLGAALADDDPPPPPSLPPVTDPSADPTIDPITDPPMPNPPPPYRPATTTVDDDERTTNINVYTSNDSDLGYAWRDNRLSSGIGVALQLGAGITGFTNDTMRSLSNTDVGGLWAAKLTLGSHLPIGIDVAYTGTSTDISSLIGSRNGTLLGTTVEGALRYNILPHFPVNPYVFAGLGWQRYDITDNTFSLSDSGIADRDDSLIVPMGAGLAWRDRSGLVMDVHGTFRLNTNSEMVLERVASRDFADMHTWEASANVGFEF
ncbi:MAG: outer membrane beta-barrel protein [Deltaproteobacteria bacterium]|nr:outer membrane beta-barrel protein [Deltaproteobacteria bacterium]MCW5803626.1 outer membrane beta-barrel protein [Deltaproteobacteria bacterium]